MLTKCLLTTLFAFLFLSQAYADAKYVSDTLPAGFFHALIQAPVPVKVMKVIDPLTFVGNDKNIYALAGIEVPNSQTGKADITLEASKKLAELIENKDLVLYVTKNRDKGRLNRMNQSVAHAEIKQDRIWVEGELLAAGLARVRTTPSNPEMVAEMLKLEKDARDNKRGLWSNSALQILNTDNVIGQENSFAIVEGTPKAAAITRNMVFLNFADDYKKDFTVGIPTNLRMAFAKRGMDVQKLAHVPLRVRGWIQSYNGPFIEIDHPEQIEVLGKIPVFTSSLPQRETPPNNAGMRTIGAPKTPEITAPKKPEIETPKADNVSRQPNP